jgi:hypothetical protein
MKEIVPKLPDTEKYDLRDRPSRSCKAKPRLIAEGYARRHQKAGFQQGSVKVKDMCISFFALCP